MNGRPALMTVDLRAVDVMSTPVVVVHADDSVAAAWNAMLRHGLRHVVVVDGALCAGVLDDRVLAMSRADVATPVGDLVAARTTCAFASTPLQHLAGLMVRDRVDAVPVIDDDGSVVGLVTARDVLAVVAAAAGPTASDVRIEMRLDTADDAEGASR